MRRCQKALARCFSTPSSRWAESLASSPSFSPVEFPRLPSSSLPPFPSFAKRPSHMAVAFSSANLHFPLIPYLILWSIQSRALSLSLFDLRASLSLQCPALITALVDLSHRPEGRSLHSTPLCVRVKRKLSVKQWRAMPAGPIKQRLITLVGKGIMPTEAFIYRIHHGTVQREGPWYSLYEDAEDATLSCSSSSSSFSSSFSPSHSPWEKAESDLHFNDDGEELKATVVDCLHLRHTAKMKGANGHPTPSSLLNGHSNGNGHASHGDASPTSAAPFLVNLLSGDDVWDEVLNSCIQLALPLPSSHVTPFPLPDDTAPPSHVLRSHVLSHAFPVYPMSEPELLLVFHSPLSLLSFPPWLQRIAEIDNVPADWAELMEREDFERILARYSHTVQKGGA
jgi:hypothetical protein